GPDDDLLAVLPLRRHGLVGDLESALVDGEVAEDRPRFQAEQRLSKPVRVDAPGPSCCPYPPCSEYLPVSAMEAPIRISCCATLHRGVAIRSTLRTVNARACAGRTFIATFLSRVVRWEPKRRRRRAPALAAGRRAPAPPRCGATARRGPRDPRATAGVPPSIRRRGSRRRPARPDARRRW